jgi:hypothetical protein
MVGGWVQVRCKRDDVQILVLAGLINKGCFPERRKDFAEGPDDPDLAACFVGCMPRCWVIVPQCDRRLDTQTADLNACRK